MKKLSAEGSGYTGVKMSPALRGDVSTVARKSEQSESAVIRAALRLAFPLLEAHPELVKQLDAGMGDEGLKALLARTQNIADKTGASVILVLRAALRMGLMTFEKGGEQVNAEFLRFADLGGFEMPSIQGMMDTVLKAPVLGKAMDAAAVLNAPDDATVEREAKERGITKEALSGPAKPAAKSRKLKAMK